MLGQQFHKCLLGSSGHWGDHSKHRGNFRVWVPWTLYPQVLCNSDLCTLVWASVCFRWWWLQDIWAQRDSTGDWVGKIFEKSGKEEDGGTFRASFKTNISELAPGGNCLLGHGVNPRARGLPPHGGPESAGILLSQGIAFAGPHLRAGAFSPCLGSSHLRKIKCSQKQQKCSLCLPAPSTSGMGVAVGWKLGVYTGDPSCTYNGVYGLHLAYLQSKACSERKSGAE